MEGCGVRECECGCESVHVRECGSKECGSSVGWGVWVCGSVGARSVGARSVGAVWVGECGYEKPPHKAKVRHACN